MASVKEVAAMLRAHDSKGKVKNIASVSARTYKGHVYASKAESLYAFELDRQKAAGLIYEWEQQITMPIRLNGAHICNVSVDFRVQHEPAGEWRYVEVKGWESEVWRLKRKLLLAMYGREFKYEVVKV